MLELLCDLGGHCEWADAVLFHTWGKGPARDQEELRRRVQHILGVQQAFLAVLRGEVPTLPGNEPTPTFAELKDWAVRVHGDLNAQVASLGEDDLGRQVQIPWIPRLHNFGARRTATGPAALAASSWPMHDPAQRIRRRTEERGLDHLGLETEAGAAVGLEKLAATSAAQ